MTWKNDFLQLYSSGNRKKYNEAIKIKQENLPERLFRFRSLNDLELRKEEIIDGMLWLAHPGTTNDPFDACSIIDKNDSKLYDFLKEPYMEHFRTEMSSEDFCSVFYSEDWKNNFIDYYVKKYDKVGNYKDERKAIEFSLKGLMEYYNEHANTVNKSLYRFACFTETNLNLPMWAHYADNHKGICLEYNITKIKSKLLKEHLFPIIYTDKLPDKFLSPYRNLAFTFYYNILIHKLSDWSYEKEWRLLFDASFLYNDLDAVPEDFWEDGKKIKFIQPSKIYLGYKVSLENAKVIKEYARKANISIARMSITPYGLIAEDYKLS